LEKGVQRPYPSGQAALLEAELQELLVSADSLRKVQTIFQRHFGTKVSLSVLQEKRQALDAAGESYQELARTRLSLGRTLSALGKKRQELVQVLREIVKTHHNP